MSTSSEEISKSNARSGGRTDANLAADALNLGGIPAEDYALKDYVQKYHDNKEKELKKYTDKQDEEVLGEAKSYADLIVGSQDFSGFAKTSDVQAVDEKLSKKIEECGAQCADNLDTKIKEVVEDVNSNFDDVGKLIDELNKSQNDLFQSVSNGKSKIAEAITDKGVSTSATDSFDTMAGNIKEIETGGGEVDPNFVNTSDATATSADLLLGKTAYAKGSKLYGTLISRGVDTSDATASSYDILEGKTAYVNGYKLTGTFVDKNLDTSDATATPYDITTGKTAYVNGRKITGVLNPSGNPDYDIGSVEKVYGTIDNYVKRYTIPSKDLGNFIKDDEIIEYTPGSYNKFEAFVQDKDKNIIGAIGFHQESEKEISSSTDFIYTYTFDLGDNYGYHRKKYSLEELGITDGWHVPSNQSGRANLEFATSIFDENGGYIAFLNSGESSTNYEKSSIIRLFKIKLSDETGDIEIDINSKVEIEADYIYDFSPITFSPTNKNLFFIIRRKKSRGSNDFYSYPTLYIINDTKNPITISSKSLGSQRYLAYKNGISTVNYRNRGFANNNQIIYYPLLGNDRYPEEISYLGISILNEYGTEKGTTIVGSSVSSYPFSYFIISIEGTYLYDLIQSKLYSLVIDYESGHIDFIYLRDIPSIITPDFDEEHQTIKQSFYLNSDGNIAYLWEKVYVDYAATGNPEQIDRVKAFSVDFEKNDVFNLIQSFDHVQFEQLTPFGDAASVKPIANGAILRTVKDYSKVIALKYEDNYYYRKDLDIFNATPADVLKSRTFIGKRGIVESGTMEVSK